MIETASSASLTIAEPRIASIDVALRDLDTPFGERDAAARPSDPGEEVLSSADILSIAAALSSQGAGPRERAAASHTPPASPVADPLIGVVVADRYRILEPIGRGGMGIVYKVEHVRIGKLLAMKLLAGELSHNPEVVRRFKREALTVSKLESPNTVQVFDFGVSEGLTYLVMELVRGDNLGRVLHAGGPMPFSRLGKILVQICSSLAEAHQKGIVHRDIKPENIMLVSAEGGADVAKVLDFGLAKLRETEVLCDVTGQGLVMGTPHYMAPEQVRGEEVDRRTDVYGLGALMYRLITGQHVFGGPSPVAVLTRHLTEPPVPPIERAPELDIPPGVSRLIMRALRKSPGDRFQRIEDLQARLIEEMRAAGSGVDGLLDESRLRRLARAAEPVALATRDELDAYERRLLRRRYGAVGVAAMLLGAAATAGASLAHHGPRFSDVELEPNDTAADATPVALGQTMTAYLGKRLDPGHGDRDFYAFDLPESEPGAPGHLRVHVGAVPNLPTCAALYRAGFADAVGQYCTGGPGRELVIPALRLDPGRYFLSVFQDLDAHGGAQPFVYENISDPYTVRVEAAEPDPSAEIEPNDQIASATPLGLSLPCSASLGWVRDEDVFCLPASIPGRVRWKVRTGPGEGGVLEATPIRGGHEGAPVRIHGDDRGKSSDADAVSPWQSAPIAGGASPRCLKIRLTTDPWSTDRSAGSTGAGNRPYQVEAEAVP